MNIDDIGNDNIIGDDEKIGDKNMLINTEEHNNNINEDENDIISNEKYMSRRKRGRKRKKETNEGESQRSTRKDSIKWNEDLHSKFVEATQQLGEGSCLPKKILKVMNVPGLTRMQVASHLQKCRSNSRRAPKEQSYIRRGSSSCSQQKSSSKKYGRMPCLQINVSNQTQRGPKFLQINTNNIFASSTQQQQLHHLQLQGLEDPIIESMSYDLDMMFKSWDPQDYSLDHNTQNDYNLDLNVAHVAYSGSAIMSNNDFENATINGMRDANTDFQQYVGEQNMSDPSNVVMTLDASNINGSDSNEKENYELYFNFNSMDYLSQNLESPSATLLNKHGSEQTQVHSDDQVCASQ
ncbi:hypothetical protein HAX54_009311 [Datura stramonium]|uniref:HTH myb-type domain-containing protein n=1 Tax=Datura stramonium TaxID=4076 RepID=A0ABS8TH75_DATST|nr:hypothetical protein [Datura stramonium]